MGCTTRNVGLHFVVEVMPLSPHSPHHCTLTLGTEGRATRPCPAVVGVAPPDEILNLCPLTVPLFASGVYLSFCRVGVSPDFSSFAITLCLRTNRDTRLGFLARDDKHQSQSRRSENASCCCLSVFFTSRHSRPRRGRTRRETTQGGRDGAAKSTSRGRF